MSLGDSTEETLTLSREGRGAAVEWGWLAQHRVEMELWRLLLLSRCQTRPQQ